MVSAKKKSFTFVFKSFCQSLLSLRISLTYFYIILVLKSIV
jgi:hypothetical protein